MKKIIKNIKQLVQVENQVRMAVLGADMAKLNCIDNAWLLIEDEKISDFGSMDTCPSLEGVEEIDAEGRLVLPAFCDSHTHIVFPTTREVEYVDKIKGLSYEEIAKRGGGILNSARMMKDATEDELFESAMQRLELMKAYGTGAVEIKSGYGLTTETEIKMLRVIKKLKEHSNMTIKSTFLGAHAFPMEYRDNHDAYVDIIVNEMIPQVAEEKLADYIDVFCDKGFFSIEETERILQHAIAVGMRPKIHANELDYSGGIQLGVLYNALSVDHLEFTGDDEIKTLLNSETMPTLLPGAAFFLGMIDPPARKMMESGLPLALATDFNPGSSPSGNMQFIMSLGSIKLRMTPEEVINAVTINGAYAMDLSETHGSIMKGKVANLIITKPIPNIEYLPYSYGDNKVERMIIKGELQELNN